MNIENDYELIESLGHINLDIYKQLFDEKIITTELVLTKNRAEHIDERRPGVLEKYKKDILETVNNPDFIVRDDKHPLDTAISIKRINETDHENLYVVIKFTLEGNNPEYKNSVMTMVVIKEKKLNQIKRNKTILYER